MYACIYLCVLIFHHQRAKHKIAAQDRSLKSFMDQILHRGHRPLRSGFFYNDNGAVFGEESAMEHLAQQLHLMDEGQEIGGNLLELL